MADLLSMFEDLQSNSEPKSRDEYLRAPFCYPGGKSRSVKFIIEHLPYRKIYVEPFGGSAAILLARHPSPLEIYNDRYGGVVCFYRCMRDKEKMERLCERIKLTVHSREEWIWCHETWENTADDVERAARWYYMLSYSFAGLGRNFGRSTSCALTRFAGKIANNMELFPKIHQRFFRVQIENQDWERCFQDFDSFETVFYLDPPYVDTDVGIYKHKMSPDDHRRLLDTIFRTKGFVAVSGYSNPLYENQNWDNRLEWEVACSISSMSFTDENNKKHHKDVATRDNVKEVLWIKEVH